MLVELRIQNLVLIESATIPFEKGLNILTGETGSGKSAIMSALSLIAGERADISLIRHGAEKAIVEGVFELNTSRELVHLLEEAGVDTEENESIIIRRELAANGRGRAFLNQQPVHVSFLRSLSAFLFEQVGQHANHLLFSIESHRKIIDLFGGLNDKVRTFGLKWHDENLLRQELDELVSQESKRLRDLDRFTAELEELEEAALKEGEDEELFAEYTKLTNTEELVVKVDTLVEDLSGDRAIIKSLNGHMRILEELTLIDPSFNDLLGSFKNASIELEESLYTLRQYLGSIEQNPERVHILNERLTLISKLKRKYGQTVTDIKAYESEIKQSLKNLQHADTRITELKESIQSLEKENNLLAAELTQLRQGISINYAAALTEQLKSLNMPHVEISVDLAPQKRCQYGDDRVEFFMKPNKGEKSIPVKDCASGGELSRLLLCIETLLVGKQAIPCLVFDEIDANIGGETATIVGEKLCDIAARHQVVAITHFPQVAMHAHFHLQITKSEKNGRTQTFIKSVSGNARKQELQRMRGFAK